MPRYALRLSLPDRPGLLGGVASALGRIDVNIVTLEVVGTDQTGTVTDLLTVESMETDVHRLRLAVERVPEVVVEAVQPVPRRHADATGPMDLAVQLAREPADARERLVLHLPEVLGVDWAALVQVGPSGTDIVHSSPGAPTSAGLTAPWLPMTTPRLLPPAPWVPTHWRIDPVRGCLAAAPGLDPAVAVLVARAAGPTLRALDVRTLARLMELADRLAESAEAAGRGPRPMVAAG